MNTAEAGKIVASVLAAYPAQAARVDRDRSLAMVETFATLLGDVTYAEGNQAVAVLLQTRTFMPSIAEIREAVVELRSGRRNTGAEAWANVIRAMREQGAHRSPGADFTFTDPLTAHAVQLMGWRDLCLSENAVADRARFIELYDAVSTAKRREQLSPALASANSRRDLAAPREAAEIVRVLGQGMRRVEESS